MDAVWVLHYRYSDGSGSGPLRVYTDDQRANEDMDLLRDIHDGKEYKLEQLPLYGDLVLRNP